MYKNEFGIVLDTSGYDVEQAYSNDYALTYGGIQRWVEDNHNVMVSKGSITMVKNKCNVSQIGIKAGKEPVADIIRTEKEKLVLETFKTLGIV